MNIEFTEMTEEDFDSIEREIFMWAIIKCGFSTVKEYYDELYHGSEGMVRFGGSFCSHLGRALMHADHRNTGKIAYYFSDEVREHAALHRTFIANRSKTKEKE